MFCLIGVTVKAGPLRGKRFPDEGGKTGYLPQGGVVSGLMLRCHRVFLLRLKLKVNAGALPGAAGF
jgi:hypothetical protein